ncbi:MULTISPECIES: CoA pyrophosphatase [Frankia]|uniref:NUDIX hydrolase n=1 Tax=Frankia sp. AvcI1 TaxID=573496 RepID=UPI000317191C|nr:MULTISPECIES: CoA pyrophosphatase [Frankia]
MTSDGKVTPEDMVDLRTRVTAAVAGFPRQELPAEGRRLAAVAVALGEDAQGRPSFLLTRRAARLRTHAGQWALPGGRAEPGEDAATAARRELAEEVGIELSAEEVLGSLDDYATRSGFVMTPVVLWAGSRLQSTSPEAREVASVHVVPLDELGAPPRFLAIPESDRPVIQLPLLGSLIHAPTGAILHQFAELVLHGRHTRVAEFEQPVFAWR